MTDEQINIKIAELQGYDFDPEQTRDWWSHGRWVEAPDDELLFKHGIPNYAADLNACHQFEKTLTDEQFDAFQIELSRVVFEHPCVVTFPVGFKQRRFWNATARQRCEAFLRVHNQREEEGVS